MNVAFCDAIRARRLVRFAYGGYERVIEPHAYGITRDGHELLTGWLVSGWSASAPGQGWLTYRIDQISDAVATSQSFTAPRRRYRFNDPRLQAVYCQLEPLTAWPVS
jgi:WYL domain-containing protein